MTISRSPFRTYSLSGDVQLDDAPRDFRRLDHYVGPHAVASRVHGAPIYAPHAADPSTPARASVPRVIRNGIIRMRRIAGTRDSRLGRGDTSRCTAGTLR